MTLEFNNPLLEAAGYWYFEHSGNWYQKVYKKRYSDYGHGEPKIYNWVLVENPEDIRDLNQGFVPEIGTCSHDNLQP